MAAQIRLGPRALGGDGVYPLHGHAMERAAMDQLLAMAQSPQTLPSFARLSSNALGEAPIKSGEAFDSNGPDFVWAVEAAAQPTLVVDDQPVGPMRRIAGTNMWFHFAQAARRARRTGFITSSTARNSAAPTTCPPTAPSRTRGRACRRARSQRSSYTRSKLYGGMETNYWIYVPAQYNPAVPAALMVWQDGERYMTPQRGGISAACARVCTGCRKSPTI